MTLQNQKLEETEVVLELDEKQNPKHEEDNVVISISNDMTSRLVSAINSISKVSRISRFLDMSFYTFLFV